MGYNDTKQNDDETNDKSINQDKLLITTIMINIIITLK